MVKGQRSNGIGVKVKLSYRIDDFGQSFIYTLVLRD